MSFARKNCSPQAVVLCALLLALSGVQCIDQPLSPVAPTYDVQLSIPLANETRTLADFIAKDSTRLTTLADGGFVFRSAQSFEPASIPSISVQPEASSQEVMLGIFTVTPPDPDPVFFNYQSLSGAPPPPTPLPFPPASYTLPQSQFGPLATFEYIIFETGTVTLEFRNDLPVEVAFLDNIVLKNNKLIAPVDTNQVAVFAFAGAVIPPNSSASRTADLSGVTMQTALRVLPARISTPGSGTTPVTLTSQSGVGFALAFSSVSVRSANAQIPRQNIFSINDSTFAVDDSVTISTALFRSGSLDLILTNNIDVSVSVYVKFAELQDRVTGQPFEISHTFNGISSLTVPINMSALRIQSLTDSIGTRATFSVGIEAIESQAFRQINSTDFVRAEVVPGSALMVESITGRITPTFVIIDAGAPGLNLGEVSGKFTADSLAFDSVTIALDFGMSGGFPVDYDLTLTGINRNVSPPKTAALTVPAPNGGTQKRIYPAAGAITSIVLGNTEGLSRFLSSFAPNFPDTLLVQGFMTINPPDVFPTPLGMQTIADTSKIYTDVDISFPVKLGIVGGVLEDTVDLGDSEKFPQEFIQSVGKGTMFFEIANGLPLQLRFRAAFLDSVSPGRTDTLLWFPADGPRTILAAVVDAGGSVTQARTSTFSISLAPREMELVNRSDVLWFRFEVETSGGTGQPVKMKESDFLTIRASGNMVYTVNR